MKFPVSYLVHLAIFAAALGLGGIFTSRGLQSDWYRNLSLAPWQPPGGFFGIAWTTIMLTFPAAMALLLPADQLFSLKTVMWLFWIQVALNISWNYFFFESHQTGVALAVIVSLAVVVGWLMVESFKVSPWAGMAVVPYLLWLCVATSLNYYVWKYN